MALKDSYLRLITSQHKDKPKYMAMVEALLDPFDGAIETATYFDDAFDLDLAVGAQQDILGDLIGQRRALEFAYAKDGASVLDDTAYRVIQKAKIIRNLWSGEIGDLYEKWLTLFGAPIRVKDNQDMTMSVLLDIDESDEMQKLMKLTAHGLIVPKPMGVRINYEFWYPTIILPVKIKHQTAIMQYVNSRHRTWNQGTARTTRFDSTYRFDRTIRWNGIYGADYREQQHHVVEIWYMVEAVQYNLVPVNVWDGSFEFDSSHRWGGSSMQRLPLHESRGCGVVVLQQARAAKLDNQIVAMNCPNVYLANPSDHASTNLQITNTPQKVKSRQIGNNVTSVKAAHHKQSIKQPAVQIGSEASREKIKIKNHVEATDRVVATLNTDYRTSNLFDGSFCFDGTHTFGGQKLQNYARATHCCSITRTTKNGLGRMETT